MRHRYVPPLNHELPLPRISADAILCLVTQSDLRALQLYSDGLTREQVAVRLNRDETFIAKLLYRLRRRLHTDTDARVLELLEARGIITPKAPHPDVVRALRRSP